MAGGADEGAGQMRSARVPRRGQRRVPLVLATAVLALVTSCVPPAVQSPNGVTVSMDLVYSDGFFSLPWPNDLRKTTAGTLDLTGFPGTDSSVELFVVSSLASSELRGFGTQTAVYLRLTGAIDPSTLPSPEQSTTADSSVQLIDLDHPGTRVPVVARIEPADRHRPSNLLSLLPYPGHTLRPDTRYAALVTSGLHDAAGDPLAEAPIIANLDEDAWLGRARSEHDWQALRAQRNAVRAALATSGTDDSLVGFTVFRTADSTREMRGVAAAVERLPAPTINWSSPLTCWPSATTVTVSGTVDLPDFQSGTFPFTYSGGGISIGPDGAAYLQGYRTYPILVRLPCAETPAEGWPIETFIDGTGGSANIWGAIGFVDDAIAGSIPPLFGGGTGGAGGESEFYNFLNPQAGRTNPIQQAANHLALIKALKHLVIEGEVVGRASAVRADPSRVMISGQSQGAQTLPLVAAMDDDVVAVVSGAGVAGFYNQVSYRRWAREQLGEYTGTDVLDIRNPWAQLVGTVEDLAEAANYPNDANHLNFAGKADGCVPLEASRHLAGAMRLSIAGAQWGSILGSPSLDPPMVDGPVTANVGGRTKVSIEAPGGHGIAYANSTIASEFTAAAFAGDAPTVPAGPYGTNDWNCEPRWGEIGDGL